MANNFRITGDIYVSKAGSDSNAGTSPDAPKASLAAALAIIVAGSTNRIVIGAGTYEESIVRVGVAITINLTGDGNVIIRGDGTNTFNLTNVTGTSSNITIANYATFTATTGLAFTGCTFRDITNCGTINGAHSFNKYINFNNGSTQTSVLPTCTSSIFINSTWRTNQFTNNYINGFSQVMTSNTGAVAFIYCNLMGKVKVGSTGTYDTYENTKANFPNSFNGCINTPPLFNDSAKEDFTLQASSPHIGAANDGTNIGGTNYGKPFSVLGSPEWASSNGAIFENVSLSGYDIVINAGSSFGRITSAPMLVSSNPVVINNINYFGLLLFNKSKAGGSDTNKNVPDANMFSGGDASGYGNPDRLTIDMRWTNTDSAPAQDSDWINGFLLPAGSFGKFIINTQPTVDNNQRGNGELNYAVNIQNLIVATWVQLRVTLRNDYQ